ncbi:MAG TPA: KTSC domain-containing protein [Lentisphaeria bacterium]|nr:KTSC domain-containing protein [Lentisphaeria bacterium]
MNRTPVISSNVASVGYDANTMTLEIKFKNGDIYQYFHVPETVYHELMCANSIGRFVYARIRDNYRYVKV